MEDIEHKTPKKVRKVGKSRVMTTRNTPCSKEYSNVIKGGHLGGDILSGTGGMDTHYSLERVALGLAVSSSLVRTSSSRPKGGAHGRSLGQTLVP